MNKTKPFARALVAMLLVLSCDVAQLAAPTGGKPLVQIASPSNGGQVTLGQEVIVQVGASDASGIARVELWVDGALATMPEILSPHERPTSAAS